MATRTQATIEDVLCRASAGERYELVDGELVEMAPTGFGHGSLEWHIARVLGSHVRGHRLGKIVVGGVLFQLDSNGRIARAADVAFIRQDRLPSKEAEHRPFVGAPDLAVEIVSPHDAADAVEQEIMDWLEHGTLAVLVVYPSIRRVGLRRIGHASFLQDDDAVDLDPVLPGFRCKAHDLFPSD